MAERIKNIDKPGTVSVSLVKNIEDSIRYSGSLSPPFLKPARSCFV